VLEKSREVIEGRQKQIVLDMKITNEDRTFGATLSYFVSKYITTVISIYVCIHLF